MIIFSVVIWGAALAFSKSALSELSPSTVITLRCLGGTILMFFLTGPLDWTKKLKWRDWFNLFVSGMTGVVAVQMVQAYSLLHTSANHAGWLSGTMPMVITAMTTVFLHERIGRMRMLGFLMGFAGVLVVACSSQQGLGGRILPTGLGDGVFLVSTFLWGFYVIQISSWFKDMPQTGITLFHMAFSLLVMAPVSIYNGGIGEIMHLSRQGWIDVAYLSILSSGICYYFWNNGVEKLGTASASSFIYIEPFTGQISSVLLLHEHISPFTAVGGLFIVGGVYWVNGGRAGAQTLRQIYNFVAD